MSLASHYNMWKLPEVWSQRTSGIAR